jgi:hypothetical protein
MRQRRFCLSFQCNLTRGDANSTYTLRWMRSILATCTVAHQIYTTRICMANVALWCQWCCLCFCYLSIYLSVEENFEAYYSCGTTTFRAPRGTLSVQLIEVNAEAYYTVDNCSCLIALQLSTLAQVYTLSYTIFSRRTVHCIIV